MGDKSYVTMEQKVCAVCTQVYDTDSLLIDRRLNDSLESKTVTGVGLCPEHEQAHNDGFVALVAIDEEKSEFGLDGQVNPAGAFYLGEYCLLKREAFDRVFNQPAPDSPFVYCQQGVIEVLKQMTEGYDEHA